MFPQSNLGLYFLIEKFTVHWATSFETGSITILYYSHLQQRQSQCQTLYGLHQELSQLYSVLATFISQSH